MSIHKQREMALEPNNMTREELNDAKKYLGYIVDDYKRGLSRSEWCLYEKGTDIPSTKIIKFIVKSITYMQVDFTYKVSVCVYWRLTVVFK